MKSIDVNSSTYFDFDVGNNDFDPEFIYKLYISWQLCDNIKVENTVDICNRKSYRWRNCWYVLWERIGKSKSNWV